MINIHGLRRASQEDVGRVALARRMQDALNARHTQVRWRVKIRTGQCLLVEGINPDTDQLEYSLMVSDGGASKRTVGGIEVDAPEEKYQTDTLGGAKYQTDTLGGTKYQTDTSAEEKYQTDTLGGMRNQTDTLSEGLSGYSDDSVLAWVIARVDSRMGRRDLSADELMGEPMTEDRIDQLRQLLVDAEERILSVKREAYADDHDPLRNFWEVSDFMGLSPGQVCMVYLMKHIQAIANGVARGDTDLVMVREDGSEGLLQRFLDARAYLVLLAAIIDQGRGEG